MTDVIELTRSFTKEEKRIIIIKLRETASKLEESISLPIQSPEQPQVRQVSQSFPHR